jgi:hypothetical protein
MDAGRCIQEADARPHPAPAHLDGRLELIRHPPRGETEPALGVGDEVVLLQEAADLDEVDHRELPGPSTAERGGQAHSAPTQNRHSYTRLKQAQLLGHLGLRRTSLG